MFEKDLIMVLIADYVIKNFLFHEKKLRHKNILNSMNGNKKLDNLKHGYINIFILYPYNLTLIHQKTVSFFNKKYKAE